MLTITSPVAYQVIQQNNQGAAMLVVAGSGVSTAGPVTVQLAPVRGGKAVTAQIAVQDGGRFSGLVPVRMGWYRLTLTAGAETATVERVGVGEVFVVAGHSVAQGDANHTLEGSTDERVVTIPVSQTNTVALYNNTGSALYLPHQFAPFTSNVYAGPFGSSTHFWGKFGQYVAQTLDCPVAVFNAAFGGTSLRHWALSATGGQFAHGFVNSAKGFPYVNLKNTMAEYVSLTGCRAVLMDQGQNDHEQTDAAVIFADYRTLVEQLRADSGLSRLGVVINQQTPFRVATAVRQAQERMVTDVGDCYAGPDYDRLLDTDRYDNVHLNTSGQEKAAQYWATVVTDSDFRARCKAYQPYAAPILSTDQLRQSVVGSPPEPAFSRFQLNLGILYSRRLRHSPLLTT
jgi:hypothetical protein